MNLAGRSDLLIHFEYPAFEEGPRDFCRRLIEVAEREIVTQDGKKWRLSAGTRARFAAACGPWRGLAGNFRPGDWVGLRLAAGRKNVAEIILLAPARTAGPAVAVDARTLREWNLFLRAVRGFFAQRGFLEVQTPTLVACPGTEPHLDVFATEFRMGRDRRRLFLPTSPELHLKKLVAQGLGPLFEIRPCFRNGEISDRHQPEFWMLEWYRPGHTLAAIEKDCRELIRACAKALRVRAPGRAVRTSMPELFKKHLGLELRPDTPVGELIQKVRELGLHLAEGSDFDDAFYLLFLEKVESRIPADSLVFLRDYPPSQAALARLTEQGWGDRFEMYWRGMELANAYHELNDPRVQRERSRADLEKRAALGKEELPLDEDFFAALEAGMPPTAGIALGLERLFLALTGKRRIEELRLFPMR